MSKMDNLKIGEYIENLKCESFFEKETNRVRIRALDNQDAPTHILIESSKVYRDIKIYPIGTQFVIKRVKVCLKNKDGEISRKYLSAKGQELQEYKK
ncbi:hypothetical protein O2K51_12445 [Apibacter raozihei]|uniref:hypothetical protein n=1 Tax=Apibacter raozihei TaxID=2500547 RepID=UPI000FE39324|nr:hypothetical protein [Apibacter raozihei]